MTRRPLFLLLALLCAAGPVRAARAEIVRIWTSHRDAESFESVGELLGQGETARGRIVVRTSPDSREGFYFLVRLRTENAVPDAQVELELIMPGSDARTKRSFKVALPEGQPVLHLGMTGADWPGAKVRPVAWRITVLAPDGSILARTQSFLWGQS